MSPPTTNDRRGRSQYHRISSKFSAHLLHRISTAASIEEEGSAIELDSQVDLPVMGKHANILRQTCKHVNFSGFTDQLSAAIPVYVVDAAMAYDCKYTGRSYPMIIQNALYLRHMKVTLIPLFMMR